MAEGAAAGMAEVVEVAAEVCTAALTQMMSWARSMTAG